MNQKRNLVIPVSVGLRASMIERVTTVAKERGFKSRSAFVRAVVEKELAADSQRAELLEMLFPDGLDQKPTGSQKA